MVVEVEDCEGPKMVQRGEYAGLDGCKDGKVREDEGEDKVGGGLCDRSVCPCSFDDVDGKGANG